MQPFQVAALQLPLPMAKLRVAVWRPISTTSGTQPEADRRKKAPMSPRPATVRNIARSAQPTSARSSSAVTKPMVNSTLLPAPPYALRPAQTPPGEVCRSDAVSHFGFEQIFAAFSRSGRRVPVRDVELRAPMSAGAPQGGFTQCRISRSRNGSADVAQVLRFGRVRGTQTGFLYGIEQSGEGEAGEM